MAVLNEETLI